jgi:predicted transcriptional regulator
MVRLTITLSDEHHRALKETAARRNTTIRRIIEESLDLYGVKTTESAAALVITAGERSGLTDDDAMALAVEETRAERCR